MLVDNHLTDLEDMEHLLDMGDSLHQDLDSQGFPATVDNHLKGLDMGDSPHQDLASRHCHHLQTHCLVHLHT